MANSSIILSNLDFDTLKNTFKSYLKSQDRFNDYDFDGANINVFLDLLAYNTFQNNFYLNMIGNEMFLDSAQLRDSVVSHAKELNYVPQSFKSAQAKVNITINSTQTSKRSLVIPKGFSFSSRLLNKSYTFTVPENIVISTYSLTNNGATIVFTGEDITLFEGFYVNDSYTYTYDNLQRLLITNKNVDVSSIVVTVIEDTGATVLNYARATSLFDLDSSSRVFFIQGAENDSYEIVFGDGVTGRRPKNNSVIQIEYRVSNGQLPNGCKVFTPDGPIQGETNIEVTTLTPAAGGTVSETVESIKYNAPRHFTSQERAITTEDYETLLKLNFPEINTVTAYGGEDLDPPQFGKVYVSVDLKEVDALPDIKKLEYYRFLKPRSPVSIDPVFVDPEYTYLGVNTKVNYNLNVTALSADDIRTIVGSAILLYAQNNLNNFNRTFRYSKLVQAIDAAQVSIISNETDITVIKVVVPETGKFLTFDVNYNIPLTVEQQIGVRANQFSVYSSFINYKGIKSFIRDDGDGILNVLSAATEAIIDTVGTVNYDTGLLQFSNFKIDAFFGAGVKFYAYPRNKDISTINNVILNIIEEDLAINVVPVRA
ncbi:baseplate wedge subunit [uncultured Caudovirales phage]|uniref:Baseplate wedge subunit n=1 Tax=uncultured Caudovirales phage TaxID=2100421 RepID=A0A6J5MHI1_9CAUD|nr:baseplate wedge subunit [uncultured Caudovirales phage]